MGRLVSKVTHSLWWSLYDSWLWKLHKGSCPALVSTHLSRSPVETLLLLMARSPARLCLLLRLLATCSPCREVRSDIDLEWTKPEHRRMRGFSDKGCFVYSILSFYSPISKWVIRAYKHTRIILGWAFRCQWFENPESLQTTTATATIWYIHW